MKAFLQGKWLGHPLHPVLVHLPVGLWVAALLFDVLSLFGAGVPNNAGNVFVQISFYAIAVGIVVSLAAILPGLADWWDAKKDPDIFKLGLVHIALNGLSLVFWIINLVVRLPAYQTATSVGVLPLILSVFAVTAVGAAGYFGGLMVYDQGASIANHSVDKWKKIAKQSGVPVKEH